MSTPQVPVRFGFLPEPIVASFSGVHIEPLPDHEQRLGWYQKNSNIDGHIYPPLVATYKGNFEQKKARKIPRTTRPAAVYCLPASHILSINAPIEPAFPHSDFALLIHSLAFIFGTRLQFEEWKFDGRVPVESKLAASISTPVRLHFVEHVYEWWKGLPSELKVRAVSLFYAYNCSIAAEWEWDAFYQHYMVFDGLFRLHVDLTSLTTKASHKGRFAILCSAYGIPINESLVDELYKARNKLFHEAMWAGAMIGHCANERNAYHYPQHLARLNARLLCAITGYRNSFTASVWWAMGQFLFQEPHNGASPSFQGTLRDKPAQRP